jgi:hypothetical protein
MGGVGRKTVLGGPVRFLRDKTEETSYLKQGERESKLR